MLILRAFRIIYTVFKYGIDGEIPKHAVPWYLQPLYYLLPGRRLFSSDTRGQRIKNALEELGPVFIKLGQLLSTRPDLIPLDICNEIRALQDNTASFSHDKVHAILRKEFNKTASELFSEFSDTPLASASIAQVHRATLHNGERVVIKLVRPNIERTIHQDIKGMSLIAKLVTALHPDGKRLQLNPLINDYKHILLDELDLLKEAANTNFLRDQFIGSNDFYVPQVHWDYCTHNALCVEYISAVPMGDIDTLKALNVDLKTLSEKAVNIFFTQLLDNNFFHADMHPGNIFVDASNPNNPKFIGIDCAIMGSLEQRETLIMAQLLSHIFKREYSQAADIFIRNKWVADDTNINELASAIRTCNEPVFAMPMEDISFSQQLMTLFATGRRFDMRVQPSFFLLQKTLFNIEGLGKQLYPQLDLWETAKPFIDRWVKQHFSPLNTIKRNAHNIPMLLDALPTLIESSQIKQPTPAKAPLNDRKPIALILTTAIVGTAIMQPNALSQIPNLAWLASGALISALWFNTSS
ncbi:MAG: AarF/UbiB family protein [Pseudomonadota bacterium]